MKINFIEKIEDNVEVYLKQSNPSITNVKLVLSAKYFDQVKKMLDKSLTEKERKAISTKSLFTYKSEKVNEITGATDVVDKTISINDLEILLSNGVFTPEQLYESFSQMTSNKHAVRQKNNVEASKQGQFLRQVKTGSKVKTEKIELSVPLEDSKYTAADKIYYTWWVKDSNSNVYMKTKDGHLMLVPMKEDSTSVIRTEGNFWTEFWKAHREDISRYKEAISSIAWNCYENTDEEASTGYNIAVECHKVVPKVFLNILSLVATKSDETITQTQESATGEVTERNFNRSVLKDIQPEVRVGKGSDSTTCTMNEDNIKDVLKYAMANFDLSEIQEMDKFTNEDTDKLSFFKIPSALFKTDKTVQMPPTWVKFLKSKFKVDKAEQLYRLANYMISIVDATNFSRQALVLCGEGNDGKSLFIDAISKFFNDYTNNKFASSCSSDGMLTGNTQNGLIDCLDARLITVADISDISKLIDDDTFKKITGQDQIMCQKKYSNPIVKDMTGVKLILSTNDKVFLKNVFATTRVIPMYFSPRDPNEPDFDLVELKNSLIKEMPEFLKWCWCYSTEINTKYSIPKNTTKIFKFDNSKTQKECFETLCDKEQKFYYMTKDDNAREDAEWFEDFLNEHFEYGEDYYIEKTELLDIWDVYAAKNRITNVYKMLPKSHDLKSLYKYIRDKADFMDPTYQKWSNGKNVRVIKGMRAKSNSEVVEVPIA